jgi:Zn-dependent protease with chaperone function
LVEKASCRYVSMNEQDAVKGLTIIAALPVVGLALWADYFGRTVDRRIKEEPLFERPAELSKVHLAALAAIFAQFGIFMGTASVRAGAPVVSSLIFVAAILIQAVIQTRLEKKLAPRVNPFATQKAGTPAQDMGTAVRGFFWATVGGVLYLASVIIPVMVTTLLSRALHLSPGASTALILVSAVGGMLGGLTLNFALGAYYLKRMLPTKELEDAALSARLGACFTEAGMPAPAIWVVETGRHREATAMITGFRYGRGVFRPGLFLSRGLMDVLTEQELRAVVLHEVSHLKLDHLKKRLGYSAFMMFATTAGATFCVFAANFVAGAGRTIASAEAMGGASSGDVRGLVGIAAAAAAFMITFKYLGRQSRMHEAEADAHCVEKLGAEADELGSALRKLDQVNEKHPLHANPLARLTGPGHPATELRIALLKARIEDRDAAETKKNDQAA